MFCRQKQPFSISNRLWSFGHLRISCVLFLITWNLLKGTIFFLHSIADLEKLLQGRVIVFIMGEAGIGKTSLVKTFLKKTEDESIQYIGACDSLFTPRPLGPLYDLALQINENWINEIHSVSSRAELFSRFVQELTQKQKPVVIVFEDIHWADEATLDFVEIPGQADKPVKMFIHSYSS